MARYAGVTGSPDESGASRREKGLSRSGNGRVRKILIQLSWRMLQFQPDSRLVRWFKNRTANSQRSRKPMIVALARKLIIALWRYVNTGVVPDNRGRNGSSVFGRTDASERRSAKKRPEVAVARHILWLSCRIQEWAPPLRSLAADAYIASWWRISCWIPPDIRVWQR